MNPLSVIIITYNEERNIERCIESVKGIADEIIVLDSYSADRTLELARKGGAVTRLSPFNGYKEQKNLAQHLASFNLILSLDADEALDGELQASILAIKSSSRDKAYSMNRCTNYCGHFIRYGLWYPDRKIRLYDRRQARWGGLNPHDRLELKNHVNVEHLKGNILHYSYNSIADHVEQNNRFSSIAARSMFEMGKKCYWYKLVLSPLWTFVNGFVLRLGFLNGFRGFAIAVNSAHQTFLKYIKLYELRKFSNSVRSKKSPELIPSSEKSFPYS